MTIPIVRPTLPPLAAVQRDLARALSSGQVTRGSVVAAFEADAARALGVRHAVAVSSCTSGLMIALRALDLRGEVILPSFTFLATGTAAVWAGLTPVFADVRPGTATIDPDDVARRITRRTRAILAVHVFGCPADCDALERIARRHRVKLIFDAAHGFGCEYRGGPVGRFGDCEVFSLSPTKLVVAAEGGLVTTNNDALARRIRIGREYGNPGNYDCEFPGLSARFEEFNAILARWGLRRLRQNVRARRRLVARLRSQLDGVPGLTFQHVPDGCGHAYKDLSIEVDPAAFGMSRDRLAERLARAGIDSRKYYFPLIHETRAMREWGRRVRERDLPVSYELSRRSLSLPLWSHMPDRVMDQIGRAVRYIHAHPIRGGNSR
jgi:dTDP-4-amino-4,6-dideoxygalactose transaminase